MLIKGHCYPLEEIIAYVREDINRGDDFCLYGEKDENELRNINYYIDDYPEVDEHDKVVYSPTVTEKKLSYMYSGQQFADVIDLAVDQKPTATIEDFIKVLNHYSEYDDFLDL